MKSRDVCLAILLLVIAVASIGFLAMNGCTAAQGTAADKLVGGNPLQPIPTTQPGVFVQPTTAQVDLHFIGDAAGTAAPIVTAAAPQPWGAIAGGVLALIATGIATYQTVGKNSAQTVIANATPAILQSMTPELIAAIPSLTALVSHPSAANVVSTLSAIGASVNTSNGVVTKT